MRIYLRVLVNHILVQIVAPSNCCTVVYENLSTCIIRPLLQSRWWKCTWFIIYQLWIVVIYQMTCSDRNTVTVWLCTVSRCAVLRLAIAFIHFWLFWVVRCKQQSQLRRVNMAYVNPMPKASSLHSILVTLHSILITPVSKPNFLLVKNFRNLKLFLITKIFVLLKRKFPYQCALYLFQ